MNDVRLLGLDQPPQLVEGGVFRTRDRVEVEVRFHQPPLGGERIVLAKFSRRALPYHELLGWTRRELPLVLATNVADYDKRCAALLSSGRKQQELPRENTQFPCALFLDERDI